MTTALAALACVAAGVALVLHARARRMRLPPWACPWCGDLLDQYGECGRLCPRGTPDRLGDRR